MKHLVVLFGDLAKSERPIGHEMMWVKVYVMYGQSARHRRPEQSENLEVCPVQRLKAVELAGHVQIRRFIG